MLLLLFTVFHCEEEGDKVYFSLISILPLIGVTDRRYKDFVNDKDWTADCDYDDSDKIINCSLSWCLDESKYSIVGYNDNGSFLNRDKFTLNVREEWMSFFTANGNVVGATVDKRVRVAALMCFWDFESSFSNLECERRTYRVQDSPCFRASE